MPRKCGDDQGPMPEGFNGFWILVSFFVGFW